MRPIEFEEANTTFEKPETMTDEKCRPLRAYRGVDAQGVPFTNTVWMPNREDIEAINAGRPIILNIAGGGMPGIALFTCNEKGEINE